MRRREKESEREIKGIATKRKPKSNGDIATISPPVISEEKTLTYF